MPFRVLTQAVFSSDLTRLQEVPVAVVVGRHGVDLLAGLVLLNHTRPFPPRYIGTVATSLRQFGEVAIVEPECIHVFCFGHLTSHHPEPIVLSMTSRCSITAPICWSVDSVPRTFRAGLGGGVLPPLVLAGVYEDAMRAADAVVTGETANACNILRHPPGALFDFADYFDLPIVQPLGSPNSHGTCVVISGMDHGDCFALLRAGVKVAAVISAHASESSVPKEFPIVLSLRQVRRLSSPSPPSIHFPDETTNPN